MQTNPLARLVLLIAGLAVVASCTSGPVTSPTPGAATPGASPTKPLVKVRYVLPWVVQGESAGNLVARKLGFYQDAGLDVEIIPGGPDVRAAALLASGSAEFSAGLVTGILSARAEGIPLVALYTQNQSDGTILVCKTATCIQSFAGLGGKRVGVWFGSDDAKVLFALAKAGVPENAVQLLPQKFSMIELFENKFDCASATPVCQAELRYA